MLRGVLKLPRFSASAAVLQTRGFPVVSESEFSRQVSVNEADKAAEVSSLISSAQSGSVGYSRKAAQSWERIFGRKQNESTQAKGNQDIDKDCKMSDQS
mmetsp:Transcript_73436/g.130206  ORF Transcript_73436/g.130206 Transcript_73436/m.130206 type:complete len:99 (-) Transcript_73436:89-385(-)